MKKYPEIKYFVNKWIKSILKQVIPLRAWRFLKKILPKSNSEQQIIDFYIKEWSNSKNLAKTNKPIQNHDMGVNILGYLQAANGLGEAARSTHEAIKTTQIPYELIDYEVGIPKNQRLSRVYAQKHSPIFKYNVNLLHINPPQLSYLWSYFSADQLSTHHNIGVWYWELTEFPNEWIKYFGLMDEVWVASQFVMDSIQAKALVPVVKIPPCIKVRAESRLSRADFNLPEDRYIFLCAYDVFSAQDRKNPQAVINAFKLAFKKTDLSVGLAIKINNARENPTGVLKLRESLKDYSNCIILEGTYSRERFNALLSLTDAYISLHRSEGFGLIPAESMYLGKPVIMTRWSGNVDYMTEKNSCGVDYELIKVGPNDSVYHPNQIWANPNIEQAADYMQRLAIDKKFNYYIGNNAKKTIRHLYSPELIGKLICTRLKQIGLY